VADDSGVSRVDLSGSLGRATWQVAWPVMVTSALFALLHLVDTFWVGRLGRAAVAAVTLSGSVFGVLFSLASVFTVGTMATAARAAGANSHGGVAATLRHALVLVILLTTPVAVAGSLLAGRLLGLFGPAGDVLAVGTPYLRWLLAASPGFFCGMVLYSVFQALGDTRTPMYVMLATNLANIVLDPILIFGWFGLPRLGTTGAAIATVSTQTLGLAAMVVVMYRRRFLSRGPLHRATFGRLLAIGGPAGLQGVTRPVTGMLMFAIVTRFGTAAMAALGIGMRALEVMFVYLSGLASAGEALVGQSLGRADPNLAERVVRRIALIGSLLQVATIPVLFAFAPKVIALFNADPDVVAHGTTYLRIIAPSLLVLGLVTGWDSAQRGAGATTVPMVAALVSNWLIKLPLCLLLAYRAGLGLAGVWLGIGASVVVETGILGIGYFRGGWKRKEVRWHS